ncbi:hypothetical protein ACF0H5_014693 [Mactra antiquata]
MFCYGVKPNQKTKTPNNLQSGNFLGNDNPVYTIENIKYHCYISGKILCNVVTDFIASLLRYYVYSDYFRSQKRAGSLKKGTGSVRVLMFQSNYFCIGRRKKGRGRENGPGAAPCFSALE